MAKKLQLTAPVAGHFSFTKPGSSTILTLGSDKQALVTVHEAKGTVNVFFDDSAPLAVDPGNSVTVLASTVRLVPVKNPAAGTYQIDAAP